MKSTLAERLRGERSTHVFLSFLGSDACRQFVYCLCHFLKDAEIHVFKDDEDNPDGEKREKILEAIKASTICIPVFSKNYTSNKWCLLELLEMVQLKKKIIPILYDVRPDDVKPDPELYRALEDLYGERKRRKLTREGETELREETMKWETVLQVVGPFTGRELKETSYVEFCKKIVGEVLDALMTDEKRVLNHLLLMDHTMEMENQFKERWKDHPERMDAHVQESKSVIILEPQETCGDQALQLSSRQALGIHSSPVGDTDLAKGVASVSLYLPDQLKGESSAQGRHFKPAENYEVFLSFYGPDNGQEFIRVLYHLLKDAGIRVFKNDKDKSVGGNIAEISEAIENSMICIVIFSKSYASSHWCLRELARMIELNKKIIPVFYDVTPDDVTLKTSLYVDALEALHVTKDGPEIREWREALREVGKITRPELSDSSGHTGFCKSIVEEVLDVLKIKEKIVKDHLVGMDDHVEKMLHFLDIEVGDIRYVRIQGMGGVGKTTLARVIFNQLSPRFEYCSFLSDTGELSHRGNIRYLLDNNLFEGHGKKVLIVLDDVIEEEEIDRLVGKPSRYLPGSRIIVTSRYETVVLVFGESASKESKRVLEMQEMNNDQALQLLSLHALGTDSPPAKYMDLSKKAVSVIGFLPLCLEIIGLLLNGKSEDYWEETIKALDKCENIQQKLSLSYETLDNKTRQIFLDTACFLVGEEQTNAIYMWEACNFDPKTGIEDLVSLSLVKVVGGKLRMHDYVKDLGRDIVDRENIKDPGKRSRLWRADEVLAILERGEGTEDVEALGMPYRELSFGDFHYQELTRKSFENLRELRFLKLWSMEGFNLVGDFKGLLPNLRWLSWHDCPEHLKAKNLNLVNLVILDLSDSQSITVDWEGWRELKIGNHLKVLDLSHCTSLEKLPDLSEYPSLERLVLDGCGGLREIGSSVGKLKALKHLNLMGCHMLDDLPKELYSLENLEELLVQCRYGFSSPSGKIGNLTSLVNLQLEDIAGLRLPESIGQCKKLKRLSLLGSRLETKLPDSLRDLESLVELDISYTGITQLPESIGALKELKVLKIHGTRIRELPHSIRKLVELGKLQVHSSLRGTV